MNDNPESAFHAYLKAFETLDPEKALPFFHLPSMFIAPQGAFAVPDVTTARALLSNFMAQLASQSYHHTDVVGLKTDQISADVAACAGTFVRFTKSGEELARVGFTYLFRHTESWKLVVAIIH